MDNVKQILVEFEITPTSTVPVPSVPVLQYHLVYKSTTRNGGATVASGGGAAPNQTGNGATPCREQTGTLALAITLDKSHTSTLNADVAVAHAIHTGVEADRTVLALLEAGNRDEAVARKATSIDSMATLLNTLALQQENREGCCARLARVIDRARDTLENMRSRSTNAMSMEVRYEMNLFRAMSPAALVEGWDSDSTHSSEDDMDAWGALSAPTPYAPTRCAPGGLAPGLVTGGGMRIESPPPYSLLSPEYGSGCDGSDSDYSDGSDSE